MILQSETFNSQQHRENILESGEVLKTFSPLRKTLDAQCQVSAATGLPSAFENSKFLLAKIILKCGFYVMEKLQNLCYFISVRSATHLPIHLKEEFL